MKKAIIMIGISVISVVVFYMFSYGLYEVCRFAYYNYDAIDWLYGADWFSWFVFAVGALISNELYSRLKRICGIH